MVEGKAVAPKIKRPSWWRKGDAIEAAWAEHHSGPGWSNTVVWVLVKGTDMVLRKEALQPDEQSGDMYLLFEVSRAAHNSMTAAVRRHLGK